MNEGKQVADEQSPAIKQKADNPSPPNSGKLSGLSGPPQLAPAPPWEVIPSAKLLDALHAGDHEEDQLWGAFLVAGTLDLLVGEASAGKTVFTYRLARSLAEGKEFLGLMPPKPLRVLHVDLESPDAVKEQLLTTVGPVPNWDFVRVDSALLLSMLAATGKTYDVIIVDPLQVASPVKDENDNAEANRQMTPFVKIARNTKAAVVLVHNAGEGNPKEKFKARGATARVDRADMVLNFDDLGGGNRRLKVVKSRYGNLGDTLEFVFAAGLNYTLAKPSGQPATKHKEMGKHILAVMAKFGPPGTPVSRKLLAERLEIVPDTPSERLFERALKQLVKDGTLLHPVLGSYALPSPENKGDSDNSDKIPDPGKQKLSDGIVVPAGMTELSSAVPPEKPPEGETGGESG